MSAELSSSMNTKHAAPGKKFANYADFYQGSAYSNFPQQHRIGGSFGIQMMKVDQEPIDLIDNSVPDLVFARTETALNDAIIDVGDGPIKKNAVEKSIVYYPASNEAWSYVPVSHSLTTIALPGRAVLDLFSQAGIANNALDPIAGKLHLNPRASTLLDKLWFSIEDASGSASLLTDGLTLQFLSVLVDDCELSPVGAGVVENKRIARVIDFIDAHLSDALTVKELANIAALSPSQFSRVFKTTTGIAVWSFVQRRRLERAVEMLLETDSSISQVAFSCGFAHQNHMTNLFSRHLGTTPGAVRSRTR